jgi:hypothetical protein
MKFLYTIDSETFAVLIYEEGDNNKLRFDQKFDPQTGNKFENKEAALAWINETVNDAVITEMEDN